MGYKKLSFFKTKRLIKNPRPRVDRNGFGLAPRERVCCYVALRNISRFWKRLDFKPFSSPLQPVGQIWAEKALFMVEISIFKKVLNRFKMGMNA